MDMEQYSQEIMPVNNIVKEQKPSSPKWESLSELVDESEISSLGGFDCNICLDTVQDPVVTLCGHLYCWPCIYKWIYHQNTSSENPNKHNPQCPVCKHHITQKTLVPLYGRGQTTKPKSDESSLGLGTVIPRRPHSASCGTNTVPIPQLNNHGYQLQTQGPATMANGPNVINPTSPTTAMLGEMVYVSLFGNTQASLYAYPNSYNLVAVSTQRARRQAIQADRSLGRVCFFLLCCVMMCLMLF
ncbi:E3 ubiquitin protein ligase RMA1H1-like protein [Tanacetum coccineum]